MVVGSGALLGGSNMRSRAFVTRTASGEAKVREHRDVRKQLSVPDETQAQTFEQALRSARSNRPA